MCIKIHPCTKTLYSPQNSTNQTRSEDPPPVDPVKEVPTEVPRKDTRKSRVSWLRVFSERVIRYTMWAVDFSGDELYIPILSNG